jgi:dethiobiotin synthetase
MKTILISGNDTEIGKTWVCKALVNYLSSRNQAIQVIKPVETGVNQEIYKGDALTAIEDCHPDHVSAYTLYTFPEPLAPSAAAKKAQVSFKFSDILEKIEQLPRADWRIIETAGGLAVPFDDTDADGRSLALEIPADYLLLVVENRLGSIHQAKVLTHYAPYQEITTGIWLNDTRLVTETITNSNYEGLKNLPVPIWGHQKYGISQLCYLDAFPL